MASKTEGIALLSMYNDEEEEEEEEAVDVVGGGYRDEVDGVPKDSAAPPPPVPTSDETPPPMFQSRSPLPSDEEMDHETLTSPIPQTPPPPPIPPSQLAVPFTLPSPPPPPPSFSLPEPLDAPWARRGALTIVDYAHDEAAMSPEPEEGEIVSSGRVVIGSELQVSDEHFEERTPPGTVHILTSSTQPEPPQPSDFPEHSKSEISTPMDFTGTETEVIQVEVADVVSIEIRKDDPLNNFLPPPLTANCPEELQEKINKFLVYKKAGKSFNADLRNRKDYRNPDFLQHAVRYQDIDQIGTCFSKDVFDPHGYDKSDYYDEIEADMKREMEKKEQERKKSQKVDFISGGTQPATVAPSLKISTQIPVTGVSATASGLQSVSTAVDAIASRQNKKTKWDKIDGDVKNPLQSGGLDNLSAVGAHAVHLSAANAGTGYTAFAQQKRREAEEKRSSERKFDKRSS